MLLKCYLILKNIAEVLKCTKVICLLCMLSSIIFSLKEKEVFLNKKYTNKYRGKNIFMFGNVLYSALNVCSIKIHPNSMKLEICINNMFCVFKWWEISIKNVFFSSIDKAHE